VDNVENVHISESGDADRSPARATDWLIIIPARATDWLNVGVTMPDHNLSRVGAFKGRDPGNTK